MLNIGLVIILHTEIVRVDSGLTMQDSVCALIRSFSSASKSFSLSTSVLRSIDSLEA